MTAEAWGIGLGRQITQDRMRDTCRVTRETTGAPDPVTGKKPRVTVYGGVSGDGPCHVQAFNAQEQLAEAAEAQFTVQRYRVDVPVASFRPAVGDEVEITTALLDPYLVGRKYRVVALLHKSAATAYRMTVEEV